MKLVKKLMKSVAMVALAAATLSIVGCGSATPETVAVDFVEKIYQKGDFEGAAKLCTKKTEPLIALMASIAQEDKSFKKQNDKMKGAKIEAADCKIDGDAATVKLKVTPASGESEEMDLTLVKEGWFLHEYGPCVWRVSINKD